MAELRGTAESDLVDPGHRDGDDGDREREERDAFERLRAALRVAERRAQIRPVERATGGERLEQEEDGGEGERSPAQGAASERRPGQHWMLRAECRLQIEKREGDAHHFGEPHFPADGARPGERGEAVDQGQRGVVPFGARAALHLLDAPQEAVEERDVGRRERQGESHVVEREPCQRDEGHHQHGRKWREGNVPAAPFEHPVVQVGRPGGEVQLAVEERVGLPDEVRRLRLAGEEAPAGEGVGEEGKPEEKQVHPMRAGPGAPAALAHAFPGEGP